MPHEMMDHAEPALEAELVSMEVARLQPFSDGRPWNGEIVKREIHGYTEQMVHCAYEIGRRLIWSREVLGYGKFSDWTEENLPFSRRTAYQYMQVAEYLLAHPKLLEPLGKASLNKVLFLTTLPDEMVDQLITEDGLLAQSKAPLEKVPFAELKKEAERLKGERDELADRKEELEEKVTELQAQIAELAGERLTSQEKKLLEKLAGCHTKFFAAMTETTRILDNAARMANEGQARGKTVSPEVYSTAKALIEGMAAWVEYERARFDRESGMAPVYDDTFQELERRSAGLPEEYRIPHGRIIPDLDDSKRQAIRPGDVTVLRPGEKRIRLQGKVPPALLDPEE